MGGGGGGAIIRRTRTRKKKTAKKLTPCLQLIFFFLHGAGKWLFMIIRQSRAAHRRRELGREGKNSRCARTHTHTRYSNEARRRISISNARAMYSVSAQPTDGRRRASSLRATVATTCCCATTAIMPLFFIVFLLVVYIGLS